MATNSKVFVSPGVYTSEVDLSFVAQSVGVTTLGIVGETLKGPAFEPIFITNFDEFSTFFGGTSPEKFLNTQIPKYEAAYIAKSYLQQSNQLFVTRILGLSGYDAGPSWSITTVANINPTTIERYCLTSYTDPATCTTSCVNFKSVPYSFTFTGCTNSSGTIGFTSNLPTDLNVLVSDVYTKFNGTTSTITSDLQTQIYSVLNTPSTSGNSVYCFGTLPYSGYQAVSAYTAVTNVYNVPSLNLNDTDLTDSTNDSWYYSLFHNTNDGTGLYTGFSFTSKVSNLVLTTTSSNCALFNSFTMYDGSYNQASGVTINYDTNTIDVCMPTGSDLTSNCSIYFSACTTGVTYGGVNIYTAATNAPYGYTLTGSAVSFQLKVTSSDGTVINTWTVNTTNYNACAPCQTGFTTSTGTGTIKKCYSGTASGTLYYYTGTSYTEYDQMVVATLRSRGEVNYSQDNERVYQVTGTSDVKIICSGGYNGINTNPFSTFVLSGKSYDGTNFQFETSLQTSNSNYISKVFGASNFGKLATDVPVFLEEQYNSLLTWSYNKGYIRGLNCNIVALPGAQQGVDKSSIAWYLEKYQSPSSPWVVSELRGNKVYNLFRVTTISDGNSANFEVKLSFANMSFENLTFDVLVRDFYDTDSAPVVLEKFTNCSMDPNQNNYVAKKIGTSNGEYDLISKYIMLEMNDDAPVDALPSGFEGYGFREYDGVTPPFPVYKTKYDYPGEVIYNPPFGYTNGQDNQVTSGGDNVRRTYLGFSDSVGYDPDFLDYKGKQLPNNICTAIDSTDWAYKTKGFHMDINASAITIGSTFTTSGSQAYNVGSATFNATSVTNTTNPYFRIYARKFTMFVRGGFDGWDIYTEKRTNSDRFALGQSGYLKGACASDRYPTATGWGAFKQISVGDQTIDYGNTDYYAYLLGIRTFANPEAVNINVFATPGVDYVNNSDLVEYGIDMIENDRADSLYVCTTPDVNLLLPTVTSDDLIYPQEAVDNLNSTGIDSNYTATYYPWVLTRDSVNNTQLYIPATAEVTRNLALTDNIAFPWFAAAGYTRGIVNAVKARKKLTQEDRDVLYQGRINPIATFSDVGTVIWGNKTLQVRQSALDRINVRRLLLQARKLISAVSVRLLFEQNDDKVRQDFLNAVNPILDAIRRDRGLYDFRVTVSSDSTDLDRNQMTGKIYIKPTRSLEFIDITFYITPTGASFENI